MNGPVDAGTAREIGLVTRVVADEALDAEVETVARDLRPRIVGATIVGAMLLGADRRSAAEFSFWLAMPTMAGAFAYDLYKSHAQMSSGNTMLTAVGFAVSFICAWIVVKTFLGYVQRHGFALFAWWRVIVGALGLVALALGK